MDKVKELQHQIGIIDAVIENLPMPYSEEIQRGIQLHRDERELLSQKLDKLLMSGTYNEPST